MPRDERAVIPWHETGAHVSLPGLVAIRAGIGVGTAANCELADKTRGDTRQACTEPGAIVQVLVFALHQQVGRSRGDRRVVTAAGREIDFISWFSGLTHRPFSRYPRDDPESPSDRSIFACPGRKKREPLVSHARAEVANDLAQADYVFGMLAYVDAGLRTDGRNVILAACRGSCLCFEKASEPSPSRLSRHRLSVRQDGL